MEKGIIEQTTPEQLEVIKQLRNYIETELNYQHKEVNIWFLIRFGKARNFNLKLLKEMFAKYVEFKRKLEADGLEKVDFYKYHWPVYQKVNGGSYYVDKVGQPIFHVQLGATNWLAVLEEFGAEAVVELMIQGFERLLNIVLPICSERAGRRIDRGVVIIDFKGAKPMEFVSGKLKGMFQKLAVVGQDYYPEMLGRLYMINAPLLFAAAWQVAKFWVHENTRNRIVIESGDGRAKLFAAIGPENLHVSVGGQRTEEFRENPGPWKEALEQSYRDCTYSLPTNDLTYKYYLTDEEKRVFRHVSVPRNSLSRLPLSDIEIKDLIERENKPQIIKSLRLSVRIPRG